MTARSRSSSTASTLLSRDINSMLQQLLHLLCYCAIYLHVQQLLHFCSAGPKFSSSWSNSVVHALQVVPVGGHWDTDRGLVWRDRRGAVHARGHLPAAELLEPPRLRAADHPHLRQPERPGHPSRWREFCHSAAVPPSTFGRCFNVVMDLGECAAK